MDFEKVKEIIVETLSCDADKVTMEATLAEDLEADSLSLWSCPWPWKRPSASPSPTRTCPT